MDGFMEDTAMDPSVFITFDITNDNNRTSLFLIESEKDNCVISSRADNIG